MTEKIEWYREVLTIEPASKVFFPLAKLYVKTGDTDEAIATLRFGLDRQPDFMEARLLLVELLCRERKLKEADEALEPLVNLLKSYPAFWKSWADSLPSSETDLSTALSMTASHLAGRPLHWSEVIEAGLMFLTSDRETSPRADVDLPNEGGGALEEDTFDGEPGADEERIAKLGIGPPEGARSRVKMPDPANLRTRTMANVLASQGDYRGAMEIFEELGLDDRAQEMRARMEMESGGAGQDAEDLGEPGEAKSRVIGFLERLASRLEARAQE